MDKLLEMAQEVINYEAEENYETANIYFEQLKEEVRKENKIAVYAKILNMQAQLDILRKAVKTS